MGFGPVVRVTATPALSGPALRDGGWWRLQVLSDDRGGRRAGERGSAREHEVRGTGQRVLVGAAVEGTARHLFRRAVRHGADHHAGGRQVAVAGHLARNSEVRQEDSLRWRLGVGEQDVGRLDVAVEQPALMGVVE